jgi:hypothetical protein
MSLSLSPNSLYRQNTDCTEGGGLTREHCTLVFSINKTDRHDITEILLKVALNTITLTPPSVQSVFWRYNEFGDKLRDIENRKLSDHMKR